MKFAKHLGETAILEWTSEYVHYRALKRLTSPRPGETEDATRAEFLFLLERELQKVESFYVKRLDIIERRVNLIRRGIESGAINLLVADLQGPRLFMSSSDLPQSHVAPSNLSEAQTETLPSVDRESLLLEHVEECRIWIMKLTQFASLNLEGFRKALKKYDKKHDFRTNLLESHYNSRVLRTQFSMYQHTLAKYGKYLDECTGTLLGRIAGNAEAGPTGKGSAALYEVRKIWNDIYSLQVRAILENDNVAKLLEITQNFDLDRLAAGFGEGSPGRRTRFLHSPSRLPEKTLLFLEREHALLLKYLLDGICLHQSLDCLQLLIDSGLDVPHVEHWMNISLVYKTLSGVPARGPSCGIVEEGPESARAARMVDLLLQHGATTRWLDVKGRNIVHQAVLAGSLSCLKSIGLPSGDRRVGYQHFDNAGCSPLFYAVQLGNVGATMFLMDWYDSQHAGYALIAPVAASDLPPDHHDVEPLILACKLGHLDLVRAMIGRRMDLNVTDHDGETALYHCAKRDYPECLAVLLDSGANPELPEKYDLWTPLFIAAASGCCGCVDVLVGHGAKRDALDRDGWTPYEHAMLRGHIALALAIKPAVVPCIPQKIVGEMIRPQKGTSDFQEYGHEFLDGKKIIRLTIGHQSGPRKGQPLVEVLDRPVTGPLGLQLRIAPSNAALGEPVLLDLPVRDEPGPIDLLLSNGQSVYYSPWDEIRFDLLEASPDASAEVVGRGSIILRTFLDDEGNPAANGTKQYVIPVLDRTRLEPMAIVSFEVLVAAPFKHEKLKEKQAKVYWKSVSTKVIGHRGLGANAGLSHPQIGENTVLSFVMAASLGAEYVEFDVQLTKDKVPVLYHDFIVSETGLDISVSNLTLKHFLNLRSASSKSRHSTRDDAFVRSNTLRRSSLELEASIGSRHDAGATAKRIIESPFATLCEAFRKVPKDIGFNVEVKYPTYDEFLAAGLQNVFEINEYCDRILAVVFEEAGDRPLLFSSFHPDVCLLLSLKQPTYPVFFLTEGGVSHLPSEPRANSLQQAVRFARDANLLGIVCHSTPLVEAPRLIQTVKQNGLLLFTYGPRNNEVEAVQLQTSQGVDAVIVDSVARIRKGMAGAQ